MPSTPSPCESSTLALFNYSITQTITLPVPGLLVLMAQTDQDWDRQPHVGGRGRAFDPLRPASRIVEVMRSAQLMILSKKWKPLNVACTPRERIYNASRNKWSIKACKRGSSFSPDDSFLMGPPTDISRLWSDGGLLGSCV